jgi:hypothetical protein
VTDILEFILKNQITYNTWESLQTEVTSALKHHEELIRSMAQYVLDGKAGGGDERKNVLGVY